MTVKINPPTRYRHWSGSLRDHPEAKTLNAMWKREPKLLPIYKDLGDILVLDGQVITMYENPGWHHLGFAPQPVGAWQWFWFTIYHGRLMRYPWLSVLAFAFGGLIRRIKNE